MTRERHNKRLSARLQGWLSRHEGHLFWSLLALALFANLLPLLVTEFLPFSDLPGHLGVVGANLWAASPATNIHRYFWLNPTSDQTAWNSAFCSFWASSSP